ATAKLRTMDSDHRLLIILSDGYPQDMNYGEDRTSQDYALHDTMMAMIEARRAEIKPFCITVDQCGDDYLRKMCDPKSYLVIQDIYALPRILPKVVESLIG
ncbi:nitric oxide reductase activation protein, partial [bacterium]|nr:nitric oxide reductase activation protein [bacterium]